MKNNFLKYCSDNKFQQNDEQIQTLNLIIKFYNKNNILKNKFYNLFVKADKKLGFYLYGDVGVGKTMLINFFFDRLKIPKQRMHFNEFMINFHNFRHDYKLQGKDNSIEAFVRQLKKKVNLIYLDEFQVTNIVDAMILGKLFEFIFLENIKIIITTNTKLNDLYKDGLQRDQFLPFISTIKKFSIQKELVIDDDYRQKNNKKTERIFHPLNEKTSFKINKNFRELTRDSKKEKKVINTKGRNFKIINFFDGVARFKFNELCDVNIGAEDYINIANVCSHVFIEDIPIFNEFNSNQQLRFITLIDIFYEKKIFLTLSLVKELNDIGTSIKHSEVFKRSISRLFEMTKLNLN